jgi:hypothetical protein
MNIEPQDSREDMPLDIVFRSQATADEIAAVTAVITAAVEEQASEAKRTVPVSRSAWQLSQRQLRKPITPGPRAWRGFSGS